MVAAAAAIVRVERLRAALARQSGSAALAARRRVVRVDTGASDRDTGASVRDTGASDRGVDRAAIVSRRHELQPQKGGTLVYTNSWGASLRGRTEAPRARVTWPKPCETDASSV